jgi:uncharacterized membrane protein
LRHISSVAQEPHIKRTRSRQLFKLSSLITLANNDKWEQPLSFTATSRGASQKVTFDLFKGSDPNVYRSVYLFVNVK